MSGKIKELYYAINATRIYLDLCRAEPHNFLGSAGAMVSRVMRLTGSPEHAWRGWKAN